MTGIAICGVGNIGAVHLANLRSLRGCRVTGIFDLRMDLAARLAAQHGTRAYASLDELLADREVEAVVVATPSSSHREVTVRALAAGRHVFVEKPLAHTEPDAQAIVDAARASGRVVQAGFCERFNPQYMEAREALRTGRLGVLRAVHTSRLAPYEWSDPAWELGVLDTAAHNIDLTLWMLGLEPVSVLARGTRVYEHSAIPHSATILMRFAGDVMAVDHIAWVREAPHPLHHCARSRMLLLGSGGAFEIDLNMRPASLLTGSRFEMCDTVILGGAGYYGCLKLQFEAFLRSIEEGAPVAAPVEDALLAEKVILAARESLRSGQEVQF
ncbi:MAG TPA: Gfo/Idh/MocA family oxidoreductase [Bryobacteraceae bacterium]|nr:Gfo/Idh/MocA family oxidoreductase [Bryobacteraceae bacterium]